MRLPAKTAAELLARASSQGLTVSATARQLIQLGLAHVVAAPDGRAGAAVGLSALLAAEHAVLMVASVLPDGEQRMRELRAQAAIAAEERLAMFSEEQA